MAPWDEGNLLTLGTALSLIASLCMFLRELITMQLSFTMRWP